MELRPSTLFLIGGRTHLPTKELNESVLRCGTGRSGGSEMKAGQVENVIIDRAGHFFPFQLVDKTATECGQWLGKQVPRILKTEQAWKADRDQRLRNGELD